jgi:predicted nucleic acid-binding protein
VHPVLLDADAVRFLFALDLGGMLRGVAGRTSVQLTEYVARHELALVQSHVEALERDRLVTVQRLLKGTLEAERYRAFQRAARERALGSPHRIDKGECEAVAWASSRPSEQRPVLVSCDRGARWLAERNGVAATDLFGLCVAAVAAGAIDVAELGLRLSPWDSPSQQMGKPPGFGRFEVEFAARVEVERTRFGLSSGPP